MNLLQLALTIYRFVHLQSIKICMLRVTRKGTSIISTRKLTTLIVYFVTDLAQQIKLSSKYFVLPLSSHKWSPVPICVQTDSLITLSSHTLHEKSLQYTECCSSSCSLFQIKINKMILQICKKKHLKLMTLTQTCPSETI